ncbi:hypothetical protein AURANDRAFT_67325 [Aureococcus anophagefferens]|uniref:Uncharacterized protein n=1 Tax=Aureococcus anophagefferens TaxID=44056 RepID=F0YKS1_AURAN|nr:hypothetical protein AURANDRAFT_67325 [Aureococcus anophagefferens]EGB04314.1 hypothetical protein AURANDRAFT_67325 [Aureococcus anophagefferens]|eukprot:XP_009041024.1 hypothetical protein AURANDRAFT_67325 [Aureococcus anophagefferens]
MNERRPERIDIEHPLAAYMLRWVVLREATPGVKKAHLYKGTDPPKFNPRQMALVTPISDFFGPLLSAETATMTSPQLFQRQRSVKIIRAPRDFSCVSIDEADALRFNSLRYPATQHPSRTSLTREPREMHRRISLGNDAPSFEWKGELSFFDCDDVIAVAGFRLLGHCIESFCQDHFHPKSTAASESTPASMRGVSYVTSLPTLYLTMDDMTVETSCNDTLGVEFRGAMARYISPALASRSRFHGRSTLNSLLSCSTSSDAASESTPASMRGVSQVTSLPTLYLTMDDMTVETSCNDTLGFTVLGTTLGKTRSKLRSGDQTAML